MPTAEKKIVLIIVSMVAFTTALLNPSVNIALPSIGRELNIPAVTLGWVNNGWILAIAACLVPTGRLSDIYGRRKLFFIPCVSHLCRTLFWGCICSA